MFLNDVVFLFFFWKIKNKDEIRTLRWPGLSPSTRDGIDRSLSKLLKSTNSLLTKSR